MKKKGETTQLCFDEITSQYFLPWKLFIGYMIITVFINFFGPWEYSNYDWYAKLIVLMYILCFLFVYTIVYFIAIVKTQTVRVQPITDGTFPQAKLLKISIIVASSVLCFMSIYRFSRTEVDFALSVAEIMAQAYTNSRSQEFIEIDLAAWVYNYSYFFVFCAMTLGIYRYKRLPLLYKILLVGVFVSSVANSILFVGAQKSIGDIIIILGSAYMIWFARYIYKIKVWQKLSIFSIIIGIVLYFAVVYSARFTLWGVSNITIKGIASFDPGHWMVNYLPEELSIGVGLFLFYLSHGYYGLALCLKLPFVWTMGLGSSFVIRDLAGRYFGTESLVANMTYPERMEAVDGWGAYSQWHTIFPWLASDFTFVGAFVVLAIVTYIYAVSWKEAILQENWISIIMISFLNILFIYVPANNQLFQTTNSVFAGVIITTLWLNRNI